MSTAKKGKDVDEHNYKVDDVVLAKIRGYPPWPAMIVDGDNVPPAVARERLTSKKTKFYCVRFFPAGDYSWLVPKDLSLLQKHEIEAYINEPHKKSGDLLAGYKIALNPAEWEKQMTAQQEAMQEAEMEEDIDQLDDGEGEEEEEGRKKKSKKRKRESEVKPRKRKESEKKGSAKPDSKEKKAPGRKRSGKKNGIRSKEAIESEDENVEADDEEAAESSKRAAPPAKKQKKEMVRDDGEFGHLANDPDAVRVKEWRHKLQRAFLGKTPAQVENMPELDQLFTTIEEHDLTIEQLQYSKLGKVMRHIASREPNPIPKEEQYHIRKRADALLEKWQGLIAQSGEPVGPGSVNGTKTEAGKAGKGGMKEDETDERPAVNGGATEHKENMKAEDAISTDLPAE